MWLVSDRLKWFYHSMVWVGGTKNPGAGALSALCATWSDSSIEEEEDVCRYGSPNFLLHVLRSIQFCDKQQHVTYKVCNHLRNMMLTCVPHIAY
jgi:hypothetical protein